MPWSLGATPDDIKLASTRDFEGKTLIFYEKLDGETTVCSRESIHARSQDGWGKPWQSSMTAEYYRFKYEIPENMWIFGENMYATHSIEYEFLPSFFFVFNIAYQGEFLAVDEVVEWAEYFELPMCPYFYIGTLQPFAIPTHSTFGKECEGYVLRNVHNFKIADFKLNVAKSVRKDHAKTTHRWTTRWKSAKLNKFKHELLTRNRFRKSVFERDSYKCVVCGGKTADVHHILERKLWSDGGYYIENGVSLCEAHHIQAEKEILTVEYLRNTINVMRPIIPSQLCIDKRYNRWGDQIAFTSIVDQKGQKNES